MLSITLPGCLAVVTALSLFELYMLLRQRGRYGAKQLSPSMRSCVGAVDKKLLARLEGNFGDAQAYGSHKASFGIVAHVIALVQTVAVAWWGGYAWLWTRCAALVPVLPSFVRNMLQMTVPGSDGAVSDEIATSLLFVSAIVVVSTVLDLPLSIYKTWVLEAAFNKTTVSTYVSDMVKSLLLQALFGLPVLSLVVWILLRFGTSFVLYLWLFLTAFSLFMTAIVPSFILPLFNDFKPFPEGELMDGVRHMAKQLGFPLSEITIMDGSRRSGHSNAFFTGFFTKRIVFYDTLLEQMPDTDEVLAVLAHEMAHWKAGHTIKMFLLQTASVGLSLYLFSAFMGNASLYDSFSFTTGERPVFVGMLLFFEFVFTPVDALLSFCIHVITRRFEFQADAFAQSAGRGEALCSGLLRMQLENLGDVVEPDPLYSAFHHTHPPLVERLTAIRTLAKKAE